MTSDKRWKKDTRDVFYESFHFFVTAGPIRRGIRSSLTGREAVSFIIQCAVSYCKSVSFVIDTQIPNVILETNGMGIVHH